MFILVVAGAWMMGWPHPSPKLKEAFKLLIFVIAGARSLAGSQAQINIQNVNFSYRGSLNDELAQPVAQAQVSIQLLVFVIAGAWVTGRPNPSPKRK